MTVTWSIASGIILYHRSISYELSIYCSSLIYFSVAIAIITTKYQKHYFYYCYLLLPLPLLSYYFATKHFVVDIKFPGVVELTTQLLILENILWLPLCRINKFGLNTLTPKTVAIPYTCGLSYTFIVQFGLAMLLTLWWPLSYQLLHIKLPPMHFRMGKRHARTFYTHWSLDIIKPRTGAHNPLHKSEVTARNWLRGP